MDPSELRERAVSAFAKGRFAEAAQSYEAYCAQAPRDSQAWLRLGDAFSRLRKKEKAAAAYYQAAKLYADSGFFPRAIAACKLVLEIEPEHSGVKDMLEEFYTHRAIPRNSTVFHGIDTSLAPILSAAGAKPLSVISTPAPIPLPGKGQRALSPADGIPIVLGQEEAGGEEGGAGAQEWALVSKEEAPSPPSWAETMKPPAIRPAVLSAGMGNAPATPPVLHGDSPPQEGAKGALETGAFYMIEDAAKAGLEAQGKNPHKWLSLAKHRALSAGQIPLFSDLPRAALMALFHSCPLRRFAPGMRVIQQGEKGDSFFVICSGEVRVFRTREGEQVELAILKEGEFFGEMALLSGKPRSAFVEAMEADTQVLEISAGVLARLSREFPRVSSALWRFYRQRLLSNVMACSVLFKPFELRDCQKLIRRFQALEVGPQTVVVAEEQMSEGLFVILIGHMEVIKKGKKIAVLKEGELFGEISLLTKAPATASVVAVERSSLLKLPANEFNALISTHPQVLELLSKLMEERINSMEEEFSLESLGWENEDFGVFI